MTPRVVDVGSDDPKNYATQTTEKRQDWDDPENYKTSLGTV